MADENSTRRRDVLRTGAIAGALGFAGLTTNGVSAQETTTDTDGGGGRGGTGVFSYSLQEGDLFRVRFRPRDPFGEPATETIPGGCLGGQPAEYQVFVVRAYRDDRNIGYRGLFAPQAALAEDLLGTTTAAGGETTTEAAMQDETTTAAGGQTTATGGDLPTIQIGEWYRVASSQPCDGMNRLAIESAQPPETTTGTQTTAETATGETTTE